MRRTPTPTEPAPDSFAGLLEHLTKSAANGSSGRPSASDSVSRRSIKPLLQRHIQPANQAFPMSKLDDEATQLSYEQALRIHSRRRPALTDDSIFNLPRPQPASAAQTPGPKKARAASIPPAKAASRNTRPSPQPANLPKQAKPAPKPPAQVHFQAARSKTKTPAAKVSPVPTQPRQTTLDSSRIKAAKAARAVRRASQLDSPIGPDREIGLESPSVQPNSPKPIAVSEKFGKTNSLQTLDGVDQNARRESIVSLRLNDAEHDRLRLRAAESGISVSAYMRSCVLEAEHLRAQVKQALAEMRANATRNESAQLSVAVSNAQSTAQSTSGATWSRLLYKSATFLLGPWLAFRSSR